MTQTEPIKPKLNTRFCDLPKNHCSGSFGSQRCHFVAISIPSKKCGWIPKYKHGNPFNLYNYFDSDDSKMSQFIIDSKATI
jgi:hypothetical protein